MALLLQLPGSRNKRVKEEYPRTEASHQEFIAVGDYTPAIASDRGSAATDGNGVEEDGGREKEKETKLRSVFRRQPAKPGVSLNKQELPRPKSEEGNDS